MAKTQVLMNAEELSGLLKKMADLLLQRYGDCSSLALLGIQRRGVDLTARLSAIMEEKLGRPVLTGSLDITLYRDDWTTLRQKPSVRETYIPFDLVDKQLVLVDDVLFTGRTIRSALEALTDFGRPAKVELLVVVDRGHRELPIHADYVGLKLDTKKEDMVDVLVVERDGVDEVRLVKG